MSKNIIIGIIVIIVVIGGGFFAWQSRGSDAGEAVPTESTNTGGEQVAQPQVEGQDVTVGEGAEATPGSVVSILYVGMLQDGTVFDSSANNNNQPLTFQLGTDGIIPGFQIGVNGMKVGGERRIAIPPALGYGAQDVTGPEGQVIIPANSTIIFDVTLVDVKPAPEASADAGAATE